MTPGRRLVFVLLLIVLGVAALRDLSRLGDAFPWRKMYDFQDFYCAGRAVDAGSNPYRYEPLHSCERYVMRNTPLYANHPALAIPAPQPPYDFVPFMALGRLDFDRARTLYAVAIVVAFGLSVVALALTGIPADIALVALLLPVGYLELDAGQIVPFSFVFLVACGAALARRRDALAGVFAALTLIEPHLGVPGALAALCFVPRARVPLLATAAAMSAIGVLTVGWPASIEYLDRVLPAQAASELAFPYQYSLTYALHVLGASPAVATIAGEASFGLLLIVGLWIAPRLARKLERRELLVFFPTACAVMAGPYLHMIALCFAIPAALVMAIRLTGTLRDVSAAALCALAIPWIMVWAVKKLFLASIFSVVFLLIRLGVTPWFAIAFASSVAALIYVFELRSPELPSVTAFNAKIPNDALAQTAWRAFTDQLPTRDVRWFAIKVPTWTALAALLAVALAALRRVPDGRPPPPP
ncbi:MAG: glycosyltransferase family 87 protein [Candidatus Tumulicola sp.]